MASDTLIRHDGTWLFPGGTAGQPIHESQPFALAEQVPAGILAKMLGVHIREAVAWQRANGGQWMGYAAEVATRSAIRARPHDDGGSGT